jgi:hypothetical protein
LISDLEEWRALDGRIATWEVTASRHSRIGRQGGTAGDSSAPRANLRDFLPRSYGFRPGKSAHDALRALRVGFIEDGLRWVVGVDISKYFDTIDPAHLRRFLYQRVKDGVVRRMLDNG